MKQVITPVQMDAVRAIIAGRSEIVAIYVYGSYADGTTNSLSDIDFAVLVREPLDPPTFDMRLDLTVALNKLFPHIEVDVQIITHKSSLPFLEEVLRNRILVAVNDQEYRVDFESTAIQRILDFQPVINEYLEAMRDRLRIGTYAS